MLFSLLSLVSSVRSGNSALRNGDQKCNFHASVVLKLSSCVVSLTFIKWQYPSLRVRGTGRTGGSQVPLWFPETWLSLYECVHTHFPAPMLGSSQPATPAPRDKSSLASEGTCTQGHIPRQRHTIRAKSIFVQHTVVYLGTGRFSRLPCPPRGRATLLDQSSSERVLKMLLSAIAFAGDTDGKRAIPLSSSVYIYTVLYQ